MKRSPIPICLLCALVPLQIVTPELNAQTVQNPSFEAPVVGSVANYNSYQFNPTGAVWTFTGNAGIAAKASEFAPPPYTPDGNQIAFLEGVGGVGGTMSQTISNFPNGFFNYKFTFKAAAFGSQSVTVLVDGTNVGSFILTGSWSFFQTIPITLYAGNHVISFTNQPSSQPTLVMLDTVGLMVTNAGVLIKIAAGNDYTLLLKSDGSLWGMGANRTGQLGEGTYNGTNLAEQILTNGIVAIAAGGDMDIEDYGQTLFIKSDGSLWGMGDNSYGELGDGTYNNKNRPEQIIATNVNAIAAGYGYSLFLKGDGSLWAMGWNTYGQLGDGSYSYNSVKLPEQIVASNVTAIAAGVTDSLFLKSDGSLWGMGYNYNGELGDGTYNETNRPEQIVASNVTAIAVGYEHSLFLKSDGSLWAMGANYLGQLGDGTYNSTNQPEQIVASNVTAIAAGYYHSLYLQSDGSLWAVGENGNGQLGDGSYNSTNLPEEIVASGVTAISAGRYHSLFLRSDGSLWGMGDQIYGELGDGNYGTSPHYSTNSPEQIVSGPVGYNQISIQPTSGGDVILCYLGIVGANYALDYAPSLSPPDWSPLATNSAGNGGMLMFTNTPDPTTNNFWRIRSVPQ